MICVGGWKSEQVDGEGIHETKVTLTSDLKEVGRKPTPLKSGGRVFQVEGTAKSEVPWEEHTWHAWARTTGKLEHREQDDELKRCNREVMECR